LLTKINVDALAVHNSRLPFVVPQSQFVNNGLVAYYFYIVKQTKQKTYKFKLMNFKLFFTAVAALAITASSFAKEPETVNVKAQKQLTADFKGASNVSWQIKNNLLEASFEWNGQKLETFYNQDGEEVAMCREITIDKLPVKALQAINQKYGDYKTTEAIEYNSPDTGLCYYLSMENGNKKTILNVSPDGLVSVFK